MSEQKAPKVKLNGRQWLAVIVCGMAYNALGILQYLARDFYVIYKESNGLTDSQMGTIMTAVASRLLSPTSTTALSPTWSVLKS